MTGTHRARWTVRAMLRSAAGPVIALVSVGAFIGLLVVLNGKPDLGAGPAVQPPSTSVAEPSQVSHHATRPEPGATTGSTPAPAAKPSASPRAARTDTPTPRAPLTVLNNSTVAGLASRAADRFRAGGWTIALVGNFRGRIASTTVYYEPGQEASARTLAAQFPAIARVLPRFPGLPGAGLTVVVTRDFAG